MRVFNIGIIGYGGFGKFLHNAWNQMDHVQVTAISDLNASSFLHSDNVRFFTDWKQLIELPDIDVIAIVTEPSTHKMIAKACMDAGKHVLIEKPLAINIADAEEIIHCRDETGMVAVIDFIMRFNPLIHLIQTLTKQGVFGVLRRVDVENYAQDEQLPPEHWFWDPLRSGGILIEHAVHFIDIVHFISPAKLVAAHGFKHDRNPEQEDQIMANVLYEGGLFTTHYHSFARPGFFESTTIKLSYDIADIELHGWIPLWANINVLVNENTKSAILSNPLFKSKSIVPILQATDESRPKGWGISSTSLETNKDEVRSGGLIYQADEILTGTFRLPGSKQEVYADCVRSSLADVLSKIENTSHELLAPLESGLRSLEVAVLATDSARNC
ncbi:MAG: Gfo/Idh/MocA family oxidoreductase [Saprospiraceae bacterium]|nr:Gfo/Idh/MocA family oxidoreductase [Saprospiraceae bacterium]